MQSIDQTGNNLRLRISALACYLLLLPVFFSTFELTSAGIKQSTYLQFALYPILLSLAKPREVISGLLVLGALLAFNSMKERCGNPSEVVLESFKMGLYSFAAIISARVANPDDFYKAITRLSLVSAALVILSFFVYLGLGLSILADGGYNRVRPHAFVSEPSAMAIPLAILAAAGIFKKNYYYLGMSVAAAAMTQSVIVGLLVFISVILCFLSKTTNARIIVISFVVTGLSLGFLIGDPENFSFIEGISPRLHSGLLAISTWGELGHNPRFITTQLIIEQLRVSGTMATGLGVEINSCLNSHLNWGYDASLVIFLFRSLGYLGITIAGLILLYTAYKAAKLYDRCNQPLFLIFTIVMIGVLINGAQGLLYFTLLGMLCLFTWNINRAKYPSQNNSLTI